MPEPQTTHDRSTMLFPTYVVVDIGCLECGSSSKLLYVGFSREVAERVAGEGFIDVEAERPPEDDYYLANPWRGEGVTALFTHYPRTTT